MKKVEKESNRLGTISIVLGLLTLIYNYTVFVTAERTPNNLIEGPTNMLPVFGFLIMNILGVIIGLKSLLFQNVKHKLISLIAVVFNLANPILMTLMLSMTCK